MENITIDVTSHVTLITGEINNLTSIPPGKRATLPKEEALNLIERGIVKPIDNIPNTSDNERFDTLVDAIDGLDPKTFGADKKPNVKALKDFTGFDVTASERDAAWKEYQRLTDNDSF